MPDYTLAIGDRSYSSWSLRGWLLFARFGIPVDTVLVDFSTRDVLRQIADFAPARTVPAVRLRDGTVVWDSLAIAEELASRHPSAGHWPADASMRAAARAMVAEMHSSFTALRSDCPMNLRTAYSHSAPSAEVLADVARIESLWLRALERSGGPWLFGEYSVADAFFAPVAARIAGYALPVGDVAAAYTVRHLADPDFRRWRAMGLAKGETLPWYARPHPVANWPGPHPSPARAVDTGVAENATCPYSGKPVTHLMTLDGRTFGFCNAFCRDKTVADPEAWPAFVAIYQS